MMTSSLKTSSLRKPTEVEEVGHNSTLIDGLPNGVVELIFRKLCTGDRARMRSVSKAWNDTLSMKLTPPLVAEPPWLIKLNPRTDVIKFECRAESRTYCFTYPIGGWCCCCGSSRGWLLISGSNRRQRPDLYRTRLLLWNPLSRELRKLPSLSGLHFFDTFVDAGMRRGFDQISSYIMRMHVFETDAIELAVALLLFCPAMDGPESVHLILCRPHDRRWTVVENSNNASMDDILFHKGKLFVLCTSKEIDLEQVSDVRKIIRKGTETAHLSGCGAFVEVEKVSIPRVSGPGHEVPSGFSMRRRQSTVDQLVESSTTGELLVVSTLSDTYFHNPVHPAGGPIPFFMCNQTAGFEVRRLDLDGNCREKLYSIGQQSMYVGGWAGTLAAAACHIDVADTVYFSTNMGVKLLPIVDEHGGIDDVSCPRYYCLEEGWFCLRRKILHMDSVKDVRAQEAVIAGWFWPNLC